MAPCGQLWFRADARNWEGIETLKDKKDSSDRGRLELTRLRQRTREERMLSSEDMKCFMSSAVVWVLHLPTYSADHAGSSWGIHSTHAGCMMEGGVEAVWRFVVGES